MAISKVPASSADGSGAVKARQPRPGDKPAGRLGSARESGISAVDWIDERTSLSGGLR